MKYKLTDEKINWNNRTLYRIQALKDFSDVKAGDLGGWIEKEENLSQNGACWVYDSAQVWGSAQVCGSAKVFGSAQVLGSAQVWDYAQVWGSAEVYGYAQVYGSAEVYDSAQVWGSAQVYDSAKVCGSAQVLGSAEVVRVCTIKPISISCLRYKITLTDEHIKIGCKCHTYEEWLNFTDDEINKMDTKAIEWWKKYKNIILEIFRLERGVK